ncbi:MAG: hypothetical protein ABIQ18_39790 [Umezawaea sp.]
MNKIKSLIERYPALSLALIGALAGLAVKYVPGLAGFDVGDIADWIAAAIAIVTGAAIQRRVTPVARENRGFPPLDRE